MKGQKKRAPTQRRQVLPIPTILFETTTLQGLFCLQDSTGSSSGESLSTSGSASRATTLPSVVNSPSGSTSSWQSNPYQRDNAVSGKVAVEQLSHLNYVVRYHDEQGSRTVDIDLVGVSPGTRGLILGETIHLHVVDPHDFEILHEVINECKSLCSLSLRLDKISRDSYYGPAYIAGIEGETSVKEDGIRKMRAQYLSESRKFNSASDHSKNRVGRDCGLIDEATFQQGKSSYAQGKSQNLARGEERHRSHNTGGSSSHGRSSSRHAPTTSGGGLMAGASLKSHLARLPLGTNGKNKEMIYDTKIVVCSYCQKSKASSQETDFYLHPYVPRTFEGSPFFFCSSCIFNWKDYRDDAPVHTSRGGRRV